MAHSLESVGPGGHPGTLSFQVVAVLNAEERGQQGPSSRAQEGWSWTRGHSLVVRFCTGTVPLVTLTGMGPPNNQGQGLYLVCFVVSIWNLITY